MTIIRGRAFIENAVYANGVALCNGGAVYTSLSDITVLSTLYQDNCYTVATSGIGAWRGRLIRFLQLNFANTQ